jgi:hypothetical protein
MTQLLDGQDASALEREIAIRAPDLADTVPLEQHETRPIDIRELVPTQTLQFSAGGLVNVEIYDEHLQLVEVGKQKAEGARRVFAQAVKKPSVRFGDHRERRAPSARRHREEPATKMPESRKTARALTVVRACRPR